MKTSRTLAGFEKGISLKRLFVAILIASTLTTGLLLFTTKNTFDAFEDLSSATSRYAMLQETANTLLQASDFLTEEAQCFAVNGDRRHLENYLAEVEEYKNRESAVSTMEEYAPSSAALEELKAAMSKSVALMDREYHAMALVISASGGPVPKAVGEYELSKEELALSDEEKMVLAQSLTHDDGYYQQKEAIYADLERCTDALKEGSHSAQQGYERKLRSALVWTSVLIIAQSLMLALALVVALKLSVIPMLKAVGLIKKDSPIPVSGSSEFMYLAEAYNKTFSAYKKSLDSLSYKAYHDELTGLYNRAGFDSLISDIDSSSVAFMLVDTDKFKEVNDTYGHDVGDKILQKVAHELETHFRISDYIFRMGGTSLR